MDKDEKIRLIIDKVSAIELEAFFSGYSSRDIDKSDYNRHHSYEQDLINSLYDLLEDLF